MGDEAERRPPIGSLIVHKLTKQTLLVIDHEGDCNASVWFTARDQGMATWRVRLEEVDTPASAAVQTGGQYL